MIKQVSRDRILDPYSLDYCQLRELCKRISDRFEGCSTMSISVALSDDKFDFDSVDEMRDCHDLPDNIYRFHIFFRSSKFKTTCHVVSDAGPYRCRISAQADHEGWCADVIETAVSFLDKYRTWYFFLFRRSSSIALATLLPLFVYFTVRFLGIIGGSPSEFFSLFLPALTMESLVFILFLKFSRLSPPTAAIRRSGRAAIGWHKVFGLVIASVVALGTIVLAIVGVISLVRAG